MGLVRTLSRNPSVQFFQSTYRKTIGHRLRDAISTLTHYLHPIIKYLIPNFIVAHYCYIISLTIICSILIYPVKNWKYIDVLFLSAGATTQGGLNTVDLNSLVLYQQVVVYIICMISTPIWIHGALVFVRLFWFERYFDGIRIWSKKNFEMRRTRTLVAREMSRTMSSGKGRKNPESGRRLSFRTSTGVSDFQSKLFSGKLFTRDGDVNSDVNGNKHRNSGTYQNGEGSNHQSPLSKGKSELPSNFSSGSSSNMTEEHVRGENADTKDNVTKSKKGFVARRGSRDINPADMYRSISILQKQHQQEVEDDGPALIIKGPIERLNELEEESETEKNRDTSKKYTGGVGKSALDSYNITNSLQEKSHGLVEERYSPTSKISYNSVDLPSTDPKNKQNASLRDSLDGEEGIPDHFSTISRGTRISESGTNANNAPGLSIQFDIRNLPRPSMKKSLQRVDSNNTALNDSLTSKKIRRPSLFRKFSTPGLLRDRLHGSSTTSAADEEDGNDADLEFTDDEEALQSTTDSDYTLKPRVIDSAADQHASFLEQMDSSKKHRPNVVGDSGRKPSGTMHQRKLQASHSFSKMAGNRLPQVPSLKKRRTQSATTMMSHTDTLNSIDSHSNFYDEEVGYSDLEEPALNSVMSSNYLSYAPNVGRNSIFVGLTDTQKIELGGVEYRATKLLCKILTVYYFGFHIIAVVLLLPWINSTKKYKEIVKSNGISPTWWAFFTSLSSFNDLGLTLTADSMASFNAAAYPLIVMIWFIIIGNTGFPILLRFIIWIMFKLTPDLSLMKENLGFLLDHPRRCFTLLFPSAATWWLFLILILMNGLDLILFVIHDLNSTVLNGLHPGYKVLDGLFQAVCTRTAGFSVADLGKLHPSVQVSYMLMMYVSVMPLAISIRRTNVYEEQSLGIYGDMIPVIAENYSKSTSESSSSSTTESEPKTPEKETMSFVSDHLRKQLSHDLWYMFLGLFIICIAEGSKIQDRSKPDFTIFQVLFEVVSAYGTVGLSLGYPGTNQSFSAQFSALSKLVIIAMLIRGRHRGLPYLVDRAIMLPSDKLKRIDLLEDLKLQRTMTTINSNKDPLLQYWKRRTRSISHGIFNAINRSKSHTCQSNQDVSHYKEAISLDTIPSASSSTTNFHSKATTNLRNDSMAGGGILRRTSSETYSPGIFCENDNRPHAIDDTRANPEDLVNRHDNTTGASD
ncbi:Trk1p Ecym_5208 [Eremothecium cymbalariae DBVPG|uniref:Potassium transport protein n=1 Tax=Eremothecium cymbalariae (strain CBS 270.75 / DBVPG 7215 / KCTC 17166 / NRRL Y-17582) TaxID=931890 RepID=I6ND35_ERECY|nr:hypothetical protein Ecym_5208 [Eremothecium cymbalariae DBVPG\